MSHLSLEGIRGFMYSLPLNYESELIIFEEKEVDQNQKSD